MLLFGVTVVKFLLHSSTHVLVICSLKTQGDSSLLPVRNLPSAKLAGQDVEASGPKPRR